MCLRRDKFSFVDTGHCDADPDPAFHVEAVAVPVLSCRFIVPDPANPRQDQALVPRRVPTGTVPIRILIPKFTRIRIFKTIP